MPLDQSPVSITLGDLHELTSARDRNELRVTELEAEIDRLKLEGVGDAAAELSMAFNHAYEIVRFAVANLDPLAVRGWPHKDLLELGKLIPELAGVSPDIRECAPDLRDFARRAAEWEGARDAGVEQEKHAAENAVKSVNIADLFGDDIEP